MTNTYTAIAIASGFIGFLLGRYFQWQKSFGREIFEESPGTISGWGIAIERDGRRVEASIYKDNVLIWNVRKNREI
jgi:hypothetical protein